MSEHNKRVWLDVFGCDEPSAMISGAVKALNEIEGISLVISGDVELLTKELKTRNCDMSRVELVEASQIVTNDDNPAEAIMKTASPQVSNTLPDTRSVRM